jgi:transcription antitermination factor NusG
LREKSFDRSTALAEAWYAVYTRFQHEKSAAALLQQKNFEVFLPVFRSVHRWCDRNQWVTLPLFPCYLFLRTSVDRKVEVLRTGGVRWFVENAKRTCEVPEGEIETLRRVCSSGASVLPHAFLRQGDHVRVHAGPLAGTEGFFVRAKNRYRVVISVELLRKGVSVEVDMGDVKRVSKPYGPLPAPTAIIECGGGAQD